MELISLSPQIQAFYYFRTDFPTFILIKSLIAMVRLTLIALFFIFSFCSNVSDERIQRIVSKMESGWNDDFFNFHVESRGPGVVIIGGQNCNLQYMIKHDLANNFLEVKDSSNSNNDNSCKIDFESFEIRRLISFFDSLRVSEMNGRLKELGIVELMIGEENWIYYVTDPKDLSPEAKEWFSSNSKVISPGFYKSKISFGLS